MIFCWGMEEGYKKEEALKFVVNQSKKEKCLLLAKIFKFSLQ